ncbi:hypothetical protein BBI01_00915 [Chryseobacterium artocarpi]|uniref:Uncharacterized protein n=1 Tax=Chryseobacterium artocarpi TaxID=1414727 RepID=A0A1B8ZZM5_9FLAO|nr:hypothetical protein [Chryseobacterium artocarpi]OCA77058.1 hypothetical protein BBI01_00915 [Chryseobacterium artocarpi]
MKTDINQKINIINNIVNEYFTNNTSINKIPAKDLMFLFVQAGVFTKDYKNGLPLRKLLRQLDTVSQLNLLPNIVAERKPINTYWFFQRSKTLA